jgi:uridine phosphorylase
LIDTISDSELILNPDGSVYHLGLTPNMVADTLITVGDPERVAFFKPYFSNIAYEMQRREFHTLTGTIQGKHITVISTGIGTDNIDIVLNEYDALFNVDLQTRIIKPNHTSCTIIRLGTSGALQPDIPLGTMLASAAAVGFDGLLSSYQRVPDLAFEQALQAHLKAHQIALQPYAAHAHADLHQIFTNNGFTSGITLTANGFYAPQGRAIRISSAYPNFLPAMVEFTHQNQRVTNMEMETAGIYGLSTLLGHQAVSLNAILANRMMGTFVKNPEAIVKQMIEKALDIVTSNSHQNKHPN